MSLPFEFKVAGTGYDRRYSSIRRYATKGSEIRLIPEPENAHDRSAIAVHMKWMTAANAEVWDVIGYVPAELSPQVGLLISSGEWAIKVASIRRFDASPELDGPRVIVRLEGVDLRRP